MNLTHRPNLLRPSGDVDVAIVGAGAAGIAAARRCLAGGLTPAVLEARGRVGGRALTASFGGHPVDLGAHWMHAGAVNPLVRLARQRGERLRRARGDSHVVVRGRFVGPAGRAEHGRAFDRVDAAICRGIAGGVDAPVSALLPPLGRWRAATEATYALISGRPLDEVSAADFPSDEFGDNYFVGGGYGAYLSRLAAGLPIALGCAVTRIEVAGGSVRLSTSAGTVTAGAAIVTVPTPLLAAGEIDFRPGLPADLADAVAGFEAGTYEHVVVNWPDAPFHGADRLAKLIGSRQSLGLMTRLDGAPFHYIELDHATVRSRQHGGRPALAQIARAAVREQFGARALDRLRVVAATDWTGDPWSRSAWAVLPPGRAGHRATLRRPAAERLWFAGEAASSRMWGTVGGAWEEGERAADEAASLLRRR